MNTVDIGARLETASVRRCPTEFVRAYYGLDFLAGTALRKDYEFWMRQKKDPEPLKDDTIDRWWLESFLQSRQLVPLKWTALQLGMKLDSLKSLRRRMDEVGPLFVYHPSPDLLGKTFEEDLLAQLPQHRFQSSSDHTDHDDFCRQLHLLLGEVFNIEIEPEYCVTSRRVRRTPPEYAKYLDILTLEPLSPRYQVWLDFGKWMTLTPDRCSVLTCAEHQSEVAPFLAGKESTAVPPEVERYLAEAVRLADNPLFAVNCLEEVMTWNPCN